MMPFPFRGIDSDNGGEFINFHLLTAAASTRSPSPARGRQQERRLPRRAEELDHRAHPGRLPPLRHPRRTIAAQQDLDAASLMSNYFGPQQKLVYKARDGAKVIKKYDTAATPHQRAQHTRTCRPPPKRPWPELPRHQSGRPATPDSSPHQRATHLDHHQGRTQAQSPTQAGISKRRDEPAHAGIRHLRQRIPSRAY